MTRSRKHRDQPSPEGMPAPGAVNVVEPGRSPEPARHVPQFANDPDDLSTAFRFRVLKFVVVLAMAWLCCLVWMGIFTANPLVLSRPQIAQSQVIITAAVPDGDSETIVVERVWVGDVKAGEKLTVLQIHDAPAVQHARSQKQPDGQVYIFPLTRFGRHYRITTLPNQGSAPLVYPATPEAIDQLKPILRERTPRSGG